MVLKIRHLLLLVLPAVCAHQDTPALAAGLPDLTQNLTVGLCDDGPGDVGADSYFVGVLAFHGKDVTGW